ncbi:hypothetical protein [Kitasatospora fiedleri]|uniref:hypothetical protein n=1 Tax=Kitasatospora fiedleri TaxID=2991545 RepID=UPI000CAE4FCF|nr:hypothetical protein [Kitasatospora fiedleri]
MGGSDGPGGPGELVEYYPYGVYGLHWEATAVDEQDEVRGIVLAEANEGWVALGHIDERRAVLFLRPHELAGLRDALVSGEFDHLMSGGRTGLRRPPADAYRAARRAGRWYRRPWWRGRPGAPA